VENITEEALGTSVKHLQCAAVQVLALNFKSVSLGPETVGLQRDRALFRLVTASYMTAGWEKAC